MSMDEKYELATAVKAVKAGGDVLKRHWGKEFRVLRKSSRELVSEVDIESQSAILSVFAESGLDYGIITEEKNAAQRKDKTWIIDPLDGTHNYVSGLPFCGISVGLSQSHDFRLGVIYFPMEDQLFHAVKGNGAYLNGTAISVSGNKNLANAVINFDNQFHLSRNSFKYFQRLAENAFTTRIFGSATMDLCLIASGKIDGRIFLGAKLPDIAAGYVILTEAGGTMTDFAGQSWQRNARQVVASNGKIHKQLLRQLKGDETE